MSGQDEPRQAGEAAAMAVNRAYDSVVKFIFDSEWIRYGQSCPWCFGIKPGVFGSIPSFANGPAANGGAAPEHRGHRDGCAWLAIMKKGGLR